MKAIAVLFALLTVLLFGAGDAAQASPNLVARLIPENEAVAPGSRVTVALEERIREGWHTYWINPGDAGQPTEIEWSLPSGWKAGEIAWPTPERLPTAGLMDFGYEGKVWLLTDIAVPSDAQPGPATLFAHVSWLVCKNICIPEDTQLSVPLRIEANPPPPSADSVKAFAEARSKLPVPSPWPSRYRAGAAVDLFLASPQVAKARPAKVEFFPLTTNAIKGSAGQDFQVTDEGLVLRLQKGRSFPKLLDGVMMLTSTDGSTQALTVHASPGPVPDVSFAPQLSPWLALLFAFLGGVILNIMPCVLPVLAMKALALASHKERRSEIAHEGFAFTAGVLVSFLTLGGALVAFKAGGAAIGWGFQLQDPRAVAVLAMLMFAVALNFAGVFEVPALSAGGRFAQQGGVVGSFFVGVLAAAVAAPCTAPFMAAALGFALTQSAAMALAVFGALGAGFAAPFLAITLSPGLLRFLPKPGRWMGRLKILLSLVMFGTTVWLLWVLARQTNKPGLVLTFGALALTGVAAMLAGLRGRAGDRMRLILSILAIAAVFGGGVLAVRTQAAPETGTPLVLGAESYSPARLEALRTQRKPVFVDATAAWCITCLFNEQRVLSGPVVKDAFAAKGVRVLVADWTSRNSQITALLAAHGRSGVPLYLYYAPGADTPVILPQILTDRAVLDALSAH